MSGFFRQGLQGLLDGTVVPSTDDIRAILVDVDDISAAITGASNAGPIVISEAGHGKSSDQFVHIHGVLGNTAANGYWRIMDCDYQKTVSIDAWR